MTGSEHLMSVPRESCQAPLCRVLAEYDGPPIVRLIVVLVERDGPNNVFPSLCWYVVVALVEIAKHDC